MKQIELIMPKMGESVAEATIIKWLKNEGDKIAIDEAVLEIATDKVDSEIPSVVEGILIKKFFNEGDVVQIGKVVAMISSDTADIAESLNTHTQPASVLMSPATEPKIEKVLSVASSKVSRISASGKFYSPLVRSIAIQEGIAQAELDRIPGSGNAGRLTKNDLLSYIPVRGRQQVQNQAKSQIQEIQKPSISVGASDEIIEMDRMRKIIADHMVMSKRVSPHVTSFVEADMSNIVKWRNHVKTTFEKRNGEKLTYTPIFIEAIVRAIRDFPMINVSLDGTRIVIRKNINIGMATALPNGNLIVPVIKNADQLNLLGLVRAVNDLSNRARTNKLLPDDVQGGTYTLSNVGTFGNIMGTPIINQPQVAIMAVGSILKKPVVIETVQGDTIGIRSMMYLSHSYDHRVIDGALGGGFVRRVADYLEQFDMNRTL
jgi:2-oxoglutarate dehydrogenase E2 component (dihydrolipoamide succinyltransferase)